MRVAQSRPEDADPAVPQGAPRAGAELALDATKPVAARLADDSAVPAASPVHRLQADLAQLTTPADARAEGLYPGWFRISFPLGASALLWAAIIWGFGTIF